MKKLLLFKILFPTILLSILVVPVNTTIDDFFMPGSQPDVTKTYDPPSNCANCHSGVINNTDQSYEPTFGWQGSMMSQAMRDPLYLASLAIANQDADFAGDLCLRCHTPTGWLGGRSEPTDGSSLTLNDKEGIDCHFCHEIINPDSTNPDDLIILNELEAMGNRPPQSGNGMFIVDSNNKNRHGPFDDADPKSHKVIYDSFYSKSDYCATCHDVSNPAFTKSGDEYILNDLGIKSPSFNTYDMFPAERTYSEWKMSAYNTPEGISGTAFGGNKATVSTCQDCHMQDVTGYGCNKNGVLLRNDLPQHDMTGGNTFVPTLITQLYPEYTDELNAGIVRARGMLQNAATLDLQVQADGDEYEAYVTITNETGHKLPSGYPEGRRMWIQLIAFDSNNRVVYESGAYDETTAELSKTIINGDETKIYEAKLAMSSEVETATGKRNNPDDGSSFHFALNNKVIKDNRIPPQGFTNDNFEIIQASPVAYSYDDGDYFDTTEYHLPSETYRVSVKLLYQTTSKEYVEFLRNENQEYKDDNTNTTNPGSVLYTLWEDNGKSTPEIMNEAEFFTNTLAIDDFNEILNKQLNIYPNPAKNEVNLSFKLNTPENVTIEVFDLNGKQIAVLFNGYQSLLENNIKWKTDHISSGIYIVKYKYGNKSTSSLLKIN